MHGIFVLSQLVRVARRIVTLIAELILDFPVDSLDVQLKFALSDKALAALITFVVLNFFMY